VGCIPISVFTFQLIFSIFPTKKQFWEIFQRIFFSSVNLTIFAIFGEIFTTNFLHHKNQKNFLPKKTDSKKKSGFKVCSIWPGAKNYF
jgi:hypothetical protein